MQADVGDFYGAGAKHAQILRSNITVLAFGDSLTAAGAGSLPYGVFLAEMLGVKAWQLVILCECRVSWTMIRPLCGRLR